MDLAPFIERASRELKSSSLSKKGKGLWAELLVASLWMEKGWKLLSHQEKTPFAEVDLVFIHREKKLINMVEVKFQSSFCEEMLVSEKQKQRLSRAFNYLCQKNRSRGLANLVWVERGGKIQEVSDFLC